MLKSLVSRLLRPAARAADLIAAGNRAEEAGRIVEACELYRQAIAADPLHPSAHLNLGAALEAKGDLAGAERAYQAVLAFDATNPFANYNLANLDPRLIAAPGGLLRADALTNSGWQVFTKVSYLVRR